MLYEVITVELEDAGADAAMEALDGKDFQGRTLRVNLAQERAPRSGGGGGYGDRGGFGGGDRGGRRW